MHRKSILLWACLLLLSVSTAAAAEPERRNGPGASRPASAVATFAGGCFWCMEPPFDRLEGVLKTTSGYMGGHVAHPTYEQVSGGGTGHVEVVQVRYDPARISYAELRKVFWRNVDPTQAEGQFCDRGTPYRSAIFYHDEDQRQRAQSSKAELEGTESLQGAIVTEIRAAATFYPAEEYHQNYYQKRPLRYRFYRYTCGRDQRLEELWGETR